MRPYLLLLVIFTLLCVPFAYSVSSGDVGESVVNIFVTTNQTFLNVTNITNITFLNVTNITNVFNITNVTNVTEINGSLILNSLNAGLVVSNGMNGTPTNITVNYSFIQARVTGNCSVGSAIRIINQDGTVTCQSTGGGGSGNITGSGTTNNLSIWTSPSNLGSSLVAQDSDGVYVIGNFEASYLFGNGTYITDVVKSIVGYPSIVASSVDANGSIVLSINQTYLDTLYDTKGRSYANITALQQSNVSTFGNISALIANKSGIGDCPGGFVQNLTSGAPQCVNVTSNNGSVTSINIVGPYLLGGNITTYGNVSLNETYLNSTIGNISIIQQVIYNTTCTVVTNNCTATSTSIHYQITKVVVQPNVSSNSYRFSMTEFSNVSNTIDTNRIQHNGTWNIQKQYAINGQTQMNITNATPGLYVFSVTYLINGVQ